MHSVLFKKPTNYGGGKRRKLTPVGLVSKIGPLGIPSVLPLGIPVSSVDGDSLVVVAAGAPVGGVPIGSALVGGAVVKKTIVKSIPKPRIHARAKNMNIPTQVSIDNRIKCFIDFFS